MRSHLGKKAAEYALHQGLTIIGTCECRADFNFTITVHNDIVDVVGDGGNLFYSGGNLFYGSGTDPMIASITYDRGRYRAIVEVKKIPFDAPRDYSPSLLAMAGITLLRNIDIPEGHWEKIVALQVMEAL